MKRGSHGRDATGSKGGQQKGEDERQVQDAAAGADPEQNESGGTLMKTSIKTPEWGHLS